MKKLSLQWRITILTALVLSCCTIALTVISISNAKKSFYALALEATAAISVEETGGVPVPEVGDQGTAAMAILPAQEVKRTFDAKSILFCILFTVAGTAAVHWMAGSALRPLRNLSGKVNTVDEHSLSERLPQSPVNDEIGKLTNGFNGMLSRLDDAFLRQKRFTANVAHELKTPLATLKTGVQVLKTDKNATIENYRENAQATLTSVDRLSRVVDDLMLLAFAGENVGTSCEEVLLDPLFEAITSELALQLDAKGMSCTINCGDLSVWGDASLLYRSFFNLTENACKYGNEGGKVEISAVTQSDKITIIVKDDGPGISGVHLPYIFDAFYRVDKSRSRATGGSGLGLSLVKTMIEACDGTIKAKSVSGHGTSFIVELPIRN